ncbi:hypothetical protein SSX86_027047 [Deinandra increscens subsp. villosa]|uniref:Transmembrane protein n=1 Tax=Deinandra increscens subsp. villosa TaxID=3103831 RepID=A0AAP0CG06_9ASTR
MDFNRVFVHVVFSLIFLLSLAISSTCYGAPPPSPPPVNKNHKTSSSLFLISYNKKDDNGRRRRRIMFTNMKKRRYSEKMKNHKVEFDWDDRVFSVMLPKGNVPPSGSSSCHNDYPNSVASLCTFSRYRPKSIGNVNDDP